jgi:acyl-CoA thioester hydrolase
VTETAVAPTARLAYPHFQTITTRWKDNDIYGHVSNVEYHSYNVC